MVGFVGENPYDSPTFGKSLSLRVDGGFNAISINPSGRDAVLAGRQGLYIIDLDDPFSPPRLLHHITPWQVADVQWSPHPAKPNWIVSTSNQKAIIWNLEKSSSNAIEHVLHGHFRAITDINFNRQHPDILATCSIDTYVHAWDLRSPGRPFYSTSDWTSGASQVKWNYKDPNILASSHGNDVCIWDLRNGSTPLRKLVGHASSVNSVDFNRFNNTEVMTCSNDGSVKFWDYADIDNECKSTINTDFPIWRGRYLPFGKGCCIMPMIGGDNNVYMMNLDSEADNEDGTNEHAKTLDPIAEFKGHTNKVTDFIWRSRHPHDSMYDNKEFQLVTWSKDCDLRLWPISDYMYNKVNYEKGKRLKEMLPNYEYKTYNREPDNFKSSKKYNGRLLQETFVVTSGVKKSDGVNHINWISGVRMNDSIAPENFFKERKFQNLGEEVSSVGHKFPKIVFEKISVSTGDLVITLMGPWLESNPEEYIFLRLKVSVSSSYPSLNSAPSFTIEENTKLTETKRKELSSTLKEIGKKYTELGLYCLEPCFRFIIGEKVDLDDIEQNEVQLMNFDISDHLDFDDVSSLATTETSISGSSIGTDDNNLNMANTQSDKLNEIRLLERDITFDSTPVPNICGMTWTASGKLLCFFSGDKSSERQQTDHLHYSNPDGQKNHFKSDQGLKVLEDDFRSECSKIVMRPKRYVDTIAVPYTTKQPFVSTDEEISSDESLNSFSDNWNDILNNDIVLRTQLPNLHSNFTNVFGSVHANSTKTAESTKAINNSIYINDFGHLIPDRKELALEYQILNTYPDEMARNNALIAEKYGFEEISHCWQILSDYLMSQEEYDPYNATWDNHPMGIRWFVKETISYFENNNNLQMLAMIACIFATRKVLYVDKSEQLPNDSSEKKVESIVSFMTNGNPDTWKNDSLSQYSASNMTSNMSEIQKSRKDPSPDTSSIQSEDYFNFRNNPGSSRRAGIWGNDINSCNISHSVTPTLHIQPRIPDVKVELIDDEILNVIENQTSPFIDRAEISKLKSYVYQYANLLNRWGLPIDRARILKIEINSENLKDTSDEMRNDQFGGIGTHWVENIQNSSTVLTFRNCNYCNLKVSRGLFICGNCQHVMHSSCARDWWESALECPTGCGCNCPEVFDIA